MDSEVLVGGLFTTFCSVALYSYKVILKNLKILFSYGCTIQLSERVILTGGSSNAQKPRVTMYDINGWVADLPELNTGRYRHGCGHYYNDDNELVGK